MTEAEWLHDTDIQRMIGFLGTGVSERKCRLLGVACCRRVWHLLRDTRTRPALEAVECYVDGQPSTGYLASYPFGHVSMTSSYFTAEGISSDQPADEAVVLLTGCAVCSMSEED